MPFYGRLGRRLGLTALAVGTAGAVLAATSFALFTSGASSQTDAFASGTVVIGTISTPLDCTIQNIEPGDSGTCTYKLTYSGSLNAWVGLSILASAVATAAYTPHGSRPPVFVTVKVWAPVLLPTAIGPNG